MIYSQTQSLSERLAKAAVDTAYGQYHDWQGRNHTVGWLITYAKSDHYFFLSHHWILFFVMLLSHTMYFVFTVSDNT